MLTTGLFLTTNADLKKVGSRYWKDRNHTPSLIICKKRFEYIYVKTEYNKRNGLNKLLKPIPTLNSPSSATYEISPLSLTYSESRK